MLNPISRQLPLPTTNAKAQPTLTPTLVPSQSPSGIQEESDFKEHAILLRSKRQEVLAANIANADTPNYQAVDVDFKASLRNAVLRQESSNAPPSELRQTATGHLPTLAGSVFSSTVALAYRVQMQPGLDNNSVNMDVERGQFADNTIRFQLALQAYEDEYKEFRDASSMGGIPR